MQSHKIISRFIFCLFLFCTGCTLNTFDHYFNQPIISVEPLEGKLIDNKYYCADDTFWIEIPAPGRNGFVIDGDGWVSFLSRLNYFYKLEICRLKLDLIFFLAQNPETEQDVLDSLFSDTLLPHLISKAPDMKVLSKEFLSIENARPVLFAMVYFPTMAITANCSTLGGKENLSSIHGIYVTFSEDFHLISMHMQAMYSIFEQEDIDDIKIKYARNFLVYNLTAELKNIHFPESDATNSVILED